METAREKGHSQLRCQRNGREYQLDMSRIQSGGETVGTVLLAFDVTEQEYAERNRREFTANVSHELKTPLTAISGMAEIIKDGIVKPEDVKVKYEDGVLSVIVPKEDVKKLASSTAIAIE